jgi:uncharacterized membrane protein YfcA
MPIEVPIFTVIFGAVFMQSVVGFGSAMIAMALLPQWLGLKDAAPLVSLIVITLEGILLVRYRAAVQWRSIWQIGLAMALGAPLGVWALGRVDSRLLLPVLGGVIVAYALYALLNWRLPELTGRRWAWGFGFVAGVLEGLFSFAGPPVIIYGQCRRWGPSEFKGNLQALFLLDHLIVISSRAIAGAYTPAVLRHYLISLPALALGVGVGLIVARVIQPGVFRTLALATLLVVGVRLFF